MPVASIRVGDYQDNLEVKVRDSGIGPLVVERFTIFTTAIPSQTKDNVVDWLPEQPDELLYSHFVRDLSGWCIAPNTEVMVFQLEGEPDDETFSQFRDRVRTALSGLTVALEYEDIYSRRMPRQERSLNWFGRHSSILDLKPRSKELVALPRRPAQD